MVPNGDGKHWSNNGKIHFSIDFDNRGCVNHLFISLAQIIAFINVRLQEGAKRRIRTGRHVSHSVTYIV